MATQTKFWIGFINNSTTQGKWVEAANLKSAKWIFALEQGLNSLTYIKGHRTRPPGAVETY